MISDIYEGECPPIDYHRGAIFTIELGCLLESGFELDMKNYPIFDESYREALNGKILRHYRFREIGFETPALFREFLARRMNEIMPYYNQLYESALRDFDPFGNYEMTTEGNAKRSTDSTRDYTSDDYAQTSVDASSQTGSKGRTLVSVTPQMQLAGNEDYATNITDSVSSGGSTSASLTDNIASKTDKTTDSVNDVNDYVTKVSGLVGMTKSSAILEFRSTLLNVDMLVIDELADLFMGVYSDYANYL